MKKKPLTEQVPFYTTLTEVKSAGEMPPGIIMQFRGKFGHAGRITENGRLYPRAVMEREIEALQEKIKERAVVGEADHPGPMQGTSTIRQSAFLITGLMLNEDGEVLGEGDVYDKPAGRDFAVMVRAGTQVGISSRGTGSSRRNRMTSQHPDFEMNKDWDGKDFEEVDSDFSLKTFDAVVGPAVQDANVADYNEQDEEEESMKIKLEDVLKNEELMKGILESETIKAKIAEAVAAKESELEADFQKRVQETVVEYMTSEEFAKKFTVEEGEGESEGDEDLTEAKCAECEASIPKGSKFCPSCGLRVAPKKDEQTQDEKNEKIANLQKDLEDQKKKNEELSKKIDAVVEAGKEKDEQAAVEKVLNESLKDQPKAISEAIREDLEGVKLTEEEAKEIVEKKIERQKKMFEALGVDMSPKGLGVSQPNDADDDKDKKPDVGMLKSLM